MGTIINDYGPAERFSIFELEDAGPGKRLRLIATCPSPSAVGTALVQLAEDRWEAGDFSTPVVGVLDGERRRWVIGLWT